MDVQIFVFLLLLCQFAIGFCLGNLWQLNRTMKHLHDMHARAQSVFDAYEERIAVANRMIADLKEERDTMREHLEKTRAAVQVPLEPTKEVAVPAVNPIKKRNTKKVYELHKL